MDSLNCEQGNYQCGGKCQPSSNKCYVDKDSQLSASIDKVASLIKPKSNVVAGLMAKSLSNAQATGEAGLKEYNRRAKVIKPLADSLSKGRFKVGFDDESRSADGKTHALDALNDATNPRVGLIGAKNAKNQPVGFLSYKTGSDQISIQHFGTDQTEKGTGTSLFKQLSQLAAKEGKSIFVASEPDSAEFYEKLGFKGEVGNHYMDKETVANYAKAK